MNRLHLLPALLSEREMASSKRLLSFNYGDVIIFSATFSAP